MWRSWFLLRNWLFVVLAVVAAAWIFCYITFPPPQGSIEFEKRYADEFKRADVRLGTSLLGNLLPFERSRVSLGQVIGGAEGCGTILFVLRGLPPILLRGRPRVVSKAIAAGTMPRGDAFADCGPVEIMSPQKVFRVSLKGGISPVHFRYQEFRALSKVRG